MAARDCTPVPASFSTFPAALSLWSRSQMPEQSLQFSTSRTKNDRQSLMSRLFRSQKNADELVRP